jgi:ATP synthase protein I
VLTERHTIDPDTQKMWRTVGTTGAVGLEIAVAIVIGYLGGTYLDRKLGTQPWLMYIGILAGIGAAIKALIRVARDYKRDSDRGDSGGEGGPGEESGPGSH